MGLRDRILDPNWNENAEAWCKRHPRLCTAGYVVGFVVLVVLLAFVVKQARAGAAMTEIQAEGLDSWVAADCAGKPLQLADGQALPPCVVLSSPAGQALRVESKTVATVAPISTGTRPVYAKTVLGTRGVKLGDLKVGTSAAPITVLCDPADALKYSSTTYSRVTDVNVDAALRQGYVSGCSL